MPSAHTLRRLRHYLLMTGVAAMAASGCQSDSALGERLFEFSPMFRYGCNSRHHSRGDAPVSMPPLATNQGRALPKTKTKGPSLLNEYAPRKPDELTAEAAAEWQLPFQTKRVVVSLLMLAAHDDIERLNLVLTPYARWGTPDRREFDSKPVFGPDGPGEFFDALREAASRFGSKSTLHVPPQPNSAQFYVRHGAEPMWAYYTGGTPQAPDIFAFKLMIHDGAARIDYIGLYDHAPTREELLASRDNTDVPPPLKPRITASSRGPEPPRNPPPRLPPGVTPGIIQPGTTPPPPVPAPTGAPPTKVVPLREPAKPAG